LSAIKLLVLVALICRRAGCETLCRPPQQRQLPGVDRAEVHTILRETRRALQFTRLQQRFFDHILQADQIGVARKRAKALIRAVAIAGRPQRQHLPQALMRALEKIHPRIRRAVERADPIAARQ
jgi:hypothetical protein